MRGNKNHSYLLWKKDFTGVAAAQIREMLWGLGAWNLRQIGESRKAE